MLDEILSLVDPGPGWKRVALIVAAGALVLGSIYWQVLQWRECRDMGFSRTYCVQHLGAAPSGHAQFSSI